jgi:outer membrane murein-binding lipoprotein Lpp
MTMTMTLPGQSASSPTPRDRPCLLALAAGLVLLPAGLALFPAGVAGQQIRPIEVVRALEAGATVTLETLQHDIRVERWDRTEIEITGSYDAEFEEVITDGDGRNFRLRVRPLEQNRRNRVNRVQDPLRVRMPAAATLDLTSVSGSFFVDGGRGEFVGQTVSGSVELAGTFSRARIDAVSGRVQVLGAADELRIQNVSGEIRVEARTPRVEAQSVSGAVAVNSGIPLERASLASVSGRVSLTAALASGADISAESHSGDVTLTLSGALDGAYRLGTFSGRLRADLPGRTGETSERGRFTPDQRMTFTIGTGSGRIEASSFSGSVTLRPGG